MKINICNGHGVTETDGEPITIDGYRCALIQGDDTGSFSVHELSTGLLCSGWYALQSKSEAIQRASEEFKKRRMPDVFRLAIKGLKGNGIKWPVNRYFIQP